MTSRLRKWLGRHEDFPNPAVLNLTGINERTCKVNGRDDDKRKMPIPNSRRRPLTPPFVPEEGWTVAKRRIDINTQTQSHFFSQLPVEVRHLIYLELYGKRRIHLEYHVGPGHNIIRNNRSDNDGRNNTYRWGWWHFICHEPTFGPARRVIFPDRGDSCQIIAEWGVSSEAVGKPYDKELFVDRKLPGSNWLRSCRIGNVRVRYAECIEVIYGSNTFIVGQTDAMLFRLSKLWPASHLSMITSLDVEFHAEFMDNSNFPTDLYLQFFKLLYDTHTFPSLRTLRILLGMQPRQPTTDDERRTWPVPVETERGIEVRRPAVPFSEEEEEAWIRPWEELVCSRRKWERLQIIVPRSWKRFFGDVLQRRLTLDNDALELLGGVEFGPYRGVHFQILL